MSEINVLIAGAVGGSISAIIMSMATLSQIKWSYDQKLKMLQMQIAALQAKEGYLK